MRTRDEVSAFLAEIAASFDDDMPRLIFADWLEEQGDPWAELIRVQCALARLFPAIPQRKALEARERELIRANSAEWLQPLRDDGFMNLYFRRGLMNVTLDADRFLAVGEKLFERSPMVSGVALTNVAAPVRLSRCRHLRYVQSLKLSLNLPGQRALRVVASEHLSQLAELSLCSIGIHIEDLPGLTNAPAAHSLQSLNLSSNSFADQDYEPISRETAPANLRELKLATCGIRPALLEALIERGWLDRLTTLSLGYNHCGDDGLSRIVGRPDAATLRSLSMPFNGIGAEGVAALCGSPYLGSLESLNLRGNELDDDMATLFAESQQLPKLRCLDLRPDYDSNPRGIGRRREDVRVSNRTRKALRDRFGERLLL
jgi:uncharacterized protein (TIGR02996 family)